MKWLFFPGTVVYSEIVFNINVLMSVVLAWYFFIYPFTFNLFAPLYLKQMYYR